MLIVDKKPNSISAEAYRTLRTNIEYSVFDKKVKIITITSTESSEGKTTTASNLALCLTNDKKKVILIDCDLRKPSIHREFRLSNSLGLTEVLLGKESILNIINKHESGLHILTAGKKTPNPSEMLGSKLMEKLLQELREIYDYVIIDTPPIMAVTDGQIISKKSDGTILVIKANKAKKNIVSQAKQSLDKIGVNIIGAVFNDISAYENKYGTYYGEEVKNNRRKTRKISLPVGT